jgi:outer membrane protein OmpA-like peptidoglycan-associated protein
MISINKKIKHLTIIFIYCCLCVFWVTIALFGCIKNSKNIYSDSTTIKGDVTLLWHEIPSANSYNIYMAESPGVTKRRGFKMSNVTPPVRVNQLDPDKSYYFVVTVVDESGESKESKELAYNPVANRIGLVYWKNLFDKSIQDYKSAPTDKGQEIKVLPQRPPTEDKRATNKNEVRRDTFAEDKTSSVDLIKEDLQSSPVRVAETVEIHKNTNENPKSAPIPVATSTDHNLLELEEIRLQAAQIKIESLFYIFFDKYSNELSPRAIEKLDRIYKILINDTDATLMLNGYSDSSGDSSINQIVSEVRAYSVKSYLSGKGIKPSRMVAMGHGAQNFLVDNTSAEGRRLNRRVEIELIIP